MTEPFRQGIIGPFHEAKLLAGSWNFKLNDISPEIIAYLWHGELDTSVLKEMAHSICNEIPSCEGKSYKDEAHLSTAVNHIHEILRRPMRIRLQCLSNMLARAKSYLRISIGQLSKFGSTRAVLSVRILKGIFY